MHTLAEALDLSLSSRANAVTDLSEDFTAERSGRWIKIIHTHHEKNFVKYHGFNSIAEVVGLPLGWDPVSPGTPLQHLARA